MIVCHLCFPLTSQIGFRTCITITLQARVAALSPRVCRPWTGIPWELLALVLGSPLPCPEQPTAQQYLLKYPVFREKFGQSGGKKGTREVMKGSGLGGSWLEQGGRVWCTGSPSEDVESVVALPLAHWGPGRRALSAHLHPGTEGCSLTLLGKWLHGVGPMAAIPPEGSQNQAIDQSCTQQSQVAVGGGSEGLFQLHCEGNGHRAKVRPAQPSDTALSGFLPATASF